MTTNVVSPSDARAPRGTVAFAFTDIEGSTVRWERDRTAMDVAVRRHDELLRAAIVENGGTVFKTIGDAFCAVFARSEDAVAAMHGAQRSLAAEDFSAVDGIRVAAKRDGDRRDQSRRLRHGGRDPRETPHRRRGARGRRLDHHDRHEPRRTLSSGRRDRTRDRVDRHAIAAPTEERRCDLADELRRVSRRRSDARARDAARDVIRYLLVSMPSSPFVALASETIALTFVRDGSVERAASLAGYADATLRAGGFARQFSERGTYEQLRVALAERLATDELARQLERGADLTATAALELALTDR